MSWDEICSKSSKVVSFIDLAGHERYLKTTLFGLTGCSPDYVMLIVGGNAGLIGMSKVSTSGGACLFAIMQSLDCSLFLPGTLGRSACIACACNSKPAIDHRC